MKKMMACLLAVCLLATLLFGCEKKVKSNDTIRTVPEVTSVETEPTQTEALLPDHYAAYREICEERLESFGVGRLDEGSNQTVFLSGLSVVRLMDFDADGTEDLLLLYMTDYDSIWSGAYEVWTYKDGQAVQATFSDEINFTNGGWIYFSLLERNGKTYIINEIDHSWDQDEPRFTDELWELNGTTFVLEEELISAGNGIVPMHYFRNNEELSQSEYEKELNAIWENMDDYYVSVSYAQDADSEKMKETLQATQENLQKLGILPETASTPSSDNAKYVGEWIVDWDQTLIATGKGGQELFGTSVAYGTSMILTADYQISYAFSFYGGSGTYQCDGDRISVDSVPTDPSIDSPLRTLTPVYVGVKLYLCMDLGEVLPGIHDGITLYWKQK